jgi:sodium-coupled neutral amino acid transporter 11
MCIIVATVVLRGAAVEPELRGPPLHAVSLIRSGVFEAIGVISFAVSSGRARSPLLVEIED